MRLSSFIASFQLFFPPPPSPPIPHIHFLLSSFVSLVSPLPHLCLVISSFYLISASISSPAALLMFVFLLLYCLTVILFFLPSFIPLFLFHFLITVVLLFLSSSHLTSSFIPVASLIYPTLHFFSSLLPRSLSHSPPLFFFRLTTVLFFSSCHFFLLLFLLPLHSPPSCSPTDAMSPQHLGRDAVPQGVLGGRPIRHQ